jgi:hypothetical protein
MHQLFRRLSLLTAATAALCVAAQGPALSQAPAPKRNPPAAPAAAPSPAAPPAAAHPAPPPGVSSQAAPAGASNIVSAGQAQVDGFRSARFGMSEAEVRDAIARDFGFKGDAVRDQSNGAERTKVLVVKVGDLLPGGGAAEVSYVMGYQSKKLMQVSLSWSKAIDEKMTPEQLFSNSSVLRSHFMSEGFRPDTVATNMPINGGILMFRGSDDKDRTVMMILQGSMTQGTDNQRVLTPTTLLLFYVADAKTPDVYRLPAGSF